MFIGIKHDTFLGIALFIVCIFFAVNSTSNIMVYFAKILAIALSVLLTALVLKSCLLDKLSFKDHKTIMNFLLVALVAVGVSVYTIYLWFWKKNGAEQALFSVVAGIYAAVLGGAITLGGVAWTISKADTDKKEEEKKKATPYLKLVRGKKDNEKVEIVESIVLEKNITPDNDRHFRFVIENVSEAMFFYKKIRVNQVEIETDTVLLTKGRIIGFSIVYEKESIDRIEIFGADALGNMHRYELMLQKDGYETKATEISLPFLVE